MKRLILHIGYPRTATTWFQEKFFPLVKDFEYIRDSNNIVYGFEELKNYPDNLIISNEEITAIKLNGKVDLDFMLNRLKPLIKHYDRVDCLVLIRRQDDIIRSAYSYYVKVGGTYTFKKYWNKINEIHKEKQWKYYSYLQVLTSYKNFFLHIFPYEAFVEDKNYFVRKLTLELKIDLNFNKIDYKPLNHSSSLIAILVIRMLNHFSCINKNYYHGKLENELNIISVEEKCNKVKGIKKVITFIDMLLSNNVLPRFYLTKKIRKTILSLFVEENKKLDKKYNLGLKKYRYY